MKRLSYHAVWLLLGAPSLAGARENPQECAAEYGAEKPMTCEWLDAPDNCWRQLVSAAQACVQGTAGGAQDVAVCK